MAMQISLDEIISMLLARVESLAYGAENQKTRFNVLARALYKKGFLGDDDVVEAVRDEHRLLKDLGLIEEMPDDEMLRSAADSLLQWIKGDADEIRRTMEDYESKMREMATKEAAKPKIDVAPASALSQLDKLSGKKQGGSKLIL